MGEPEVAIVSHPSADSDVGPETDPDAFVVTAPPAEEEGEPDPAVSDPEGLDPAASDPTALDPVESLVGEGVPDPREAAGAWVAGDSPPMGSLMGFSVATGV